MGRAVIIYVIGLGCLIAYALWNINNAGLSTVDTYMTYYGRTVANSIATAAANVGVQKEFRGVFVPVTGKSFWNGQYDLSKQVLDQYTVRITAVSRFFVPKSIQYPNGIVSDTIVARLEKIPFRQYARFSENEDGLIWFGGIYRMHTNKRYTMAGSGYASPAPYFSGAVSCNLHWNVYSGTATPVWAGGYQEGITIPRPTLALNKIYDTANATGSIMNNTDVYLHFKNNGKVDIKAPANGSIRNDHNVKMEDFAPNGVFAVKGGNLFIKGTYRGAVTIEALQGGVGGKGSIFIIDDGIRADDDPQFNINSLDYLGLVAENHILVETATRPTSTGQQVYCQAALYTQNGQIGVENIFGLPTYYLGDVYFFGNEVANRGAAFRTTSNQGFTNGWVYNDPRLKFQGPPLFPVSTRYQLVSWWESEAPPIY
jgi:hypothetical protein